MAQIHTPTMWVVCGRDTPGARAVNGYPRGTAYITERVFEEAEILRCRKKSWNLLFASDGMDGEFYTDTYVVDEAGELVGHYLCGKVLWYADFSRGGDHDNSYTWLDGDLVRLGFSRW